MLSHAPLSAVPAQGGRIKVPTFKNTKNINSTIELFSESVNYLFNVDYPTSDLGRKPYVNHQYFEFVFYGRVDQELRPRILNAKNFLKPIKAGQNRTNKNAPMRLVSPVADAANAMIRDYELAYAAGKIDKSDPFLSQLRPLKAAVSFPKTYQTYMKKIFDVFVKNYVRHHISTYNDFRTFDDFMRAFRDYNLYYPQIMITPSTFLLSTQCDPFVSGLMFAIAEVDPADNEAKYNDFIQSPNAPLFQQIAVNHGFSIDKNRPWVLIADLKSPAMKDKYLSQYNSDTDVGSFFNDFYELPYASDIELLRAAALNFYNGMIDKRPNDVVAKNSGCSVKPERITRTKNTLENLKKDYKDEYWIDLYVDLKAKETMIKDLDKATINEIKKKSIDTLHLFGLTRAVTYVNLSLRDYQPNREGTYFQAKQRAANRQENVSDE